MDGNIGCGMYIYGTVAIMFIGNIGYSYLWKINKAFFTQARITESGFATTAIIITIIIYYALLWFYKTYYSSMSEIGEREHKLKLDIKAMEDLFDEEQKKLNAIKTGLDKILEEKTKGFPWIAKAYADYISTLDRNTADYLEKKTRPAKTAAEQVRDIARTKREFATRMKVAEYTIAYYESLFPWLSDFKEIEEDELIQIADQSEITDIDDSARYWLSEGEYANLPITDKYQLALDRYVKGKKTRWQIGRDYERYVGYIYEQKGYKVKYHGIIEGFEDLGRDLICVKKDEVVIIQCKYWASRKVIHEKHINQLFGTAVMYSIQQGSNINNLFSSPQLPPNLRAILITSTGLSDTARKFASALGIEVQENFKTDKYPMIKCNINPSSHEKIYHLPFDQQYDKVLCVNSGECYISTVKEAEKLGFRRAMRWRGNS